MAKDVAVIGLGNPLMSDEGIGVRLIEQLAEGGSDYPGVAFIDGGTGGVSILHHIAGRRKVVFVDCAYMGAEVGAIRRFSPDDVESTKVLTHRSLHEADLLKVLQMAKQLGDAPEEIVIFGIEPGKVEPGMELSGDLEKRVGHYAALVAGELDA